MQLAEVTIISSGFSYSPVKKPHNNTVNLLTILLNSKYFTDAIEAFIHKNNIKQEAIELVTGNITKDLIDKWEKDSKTPDIQAITATLGLPTELELDIYLLAKFKTFRDMDRYPLIWVYPNKWSLKVNMDDIAKSSKECGGIVWYHQIDRKELHKWIDENWEYIEGRNTELPVSPIIKTDFHDIELINEIYGLYNFGQTPTQILRLLDEKYKDDREFTDSLSLEVIKNKISRFKKLLKQKQTKLQPTEIIYD